MISVTRMTRSLVLGLLGCNNDSQVGGGEGNLFRLAVIADRFDRATFHGFLAELLFFRSFGLLIDVGVTAIVVTGEVGRSGFPAQIAVDALVIDIKLTLNIFNVAIRDVCHIQGITGQGVWRK